MPQIRLSGESRSPAQGFQTGKPSIRGCLSYYGLLSNAPNKSISYQQRKSKLFPSPLTGEGLDGGELRFILPSPPSPPARGEDSFKESYFYGKGF